MPYVCTSFYTSQCPVTVVHNNWIVSKEAKIYRFREHLMWVFDGSDRYYSSETRKYLTYTNPKPETSNNSLSSSEQKQLLQRQVLALRTALAIGYLLDRTVLQCYRSFTVLTRYIRLPLLCLTLTTEGFPWDDLRKILPRCQQMASVPDGVQKLLLSQAIRACKNITARSVHLTSLYPAALTSTNDQFSVLRYYVCS